MVSKRMNERDQSAWYYKTSVTMSDPATDFEYTARIDICPRFCERVWIHRVFQDHLENSLISYYKARNGDYSKLMRLGARAAVKALKLIKGGK